MTDYCLTVCCEKFTQYLSYHRKQNSWMASDGVYETLWGDLDGVDEEVTKSLCNDGIKKDVQNQLGLVYRMIRDVEVVNANIKVEKKVNIILLDPLDLGEGLPKYKRKQVPKKRWM